MSQPHPEPTLRRDVVSYVRRGSRMNLSQHRAWEGLHDRYVIEPARAARVTSVAPDATVDWAAAFGRTAPLLIEIGTGTGEALAAWAASEPQADVVGFEVFEPAVASTLSRLARDDVTNARVIVADGAQALNVLFGPESVTELRTFFPDPWHKKRHHKRRLVNAEFAALVASRLIPGGRWRLATDWPDYAEWIRSVLDSSVLVNEYDGWAPRCQSRPVTKFEQRAIDAGRHIYELSYRKAKMTIPDAGTVRLAQPLDATTQENQARGTVPLAASANSSYPT